MNFKKVMAGSLASIMAVSSLAVAASAKGYTPTDEEKISISLGALPEKTG